MARRNIPLCENAMAEIRQTLSAMPPECSAWRSITKAHRVYLLMASGLCAERHADPLESFSAEEQAKITVQVKAGGELARRWSKLHWRK